MDTSRPLPLVPEDRFRSPLPHLQRAAWATVLAATSKHGRDPIAVCRALYGDDATTVAVLELKAAVAGATTTTPTWAQELAATAVSNFISGLTPASAMSEVIRRGVTVPLGANSRLSVPSRSSTPIVGGWVGEAQGVPVVQLPIGASVMIPRKAGFAVSMTRELAQNTAAEQVFGVMLQEAAGVVVDSLYLSSSAATSIGIAGLLSGVTPTGSTGSAVDDLGKLAETVGNPDGSGETVFVASVGVAASLNLRNDIRPGTVILGSVAVPSSRLIAIDPKSVIHGLSPVPDILASPDGLLHMEDTNPQNIGTVGTPNVVAAPSQSLYQTAMIAMRLFIDLCWVKRRATGVAYVDPIAW